MFLSPPRHFDFPPAINWLLRGMRGSVAILKQSAKYRSRGSQKSKAVLHILFFVGMHPREFWVTQPISRAQFEGALSLETKACFNVSGRFLQPSHI